MDWYLCCEKKSRRIWLVTYSSPGIVIVHIPVAHTWYYRNASEVERASDEMFKLCADDAYQMQRLLANAKVSEIPQSARAFCVAAWLPA